MELQNICLSLCTNRFNPFGPFGAPYSCWPVILIVSNWPLEMCMKLDFIFLFVVISGPYSPCRNIDIYLQPLINELNQVWWVEVVTYDVSRKHNFQMKIALMYIINDFLDYEIVSGCSTYEKLFYSYYMENNKALTLTNSGKAFFFNFH
jgi:hypothetical protein